MVQRPRRKHYHHEVRSNRSDSVDTQVSGERRKRDGGWVKNNKPTGKGTRAVGDKNETKRGRQTKTMNKDAQGRRGCEPHRIQRSLIIAMRIINKQRGRTACCLTFTTIQGNPESPINVLIRTSNYIRHNTTTVGLEDT